MSVIDNLLSSMKPGDFLYIDLLAAFTNALNGALLCQRPDHYKGNYFTIVGVLIFAILGGVGGGVSRDILLNDAPGALTNPWYLILVLVAGVIGIQTAWGAGQKFRESYFQLMTSFSLPWYAVVGVEKGLEAQWPLIGAVALGVVGPTAGRFLIDIGCRVPAKMFIRGEWFIGTAVLTSIVFLFLRVGAFDGPGLSLGLVPASLIAFAAGFAFRVAALWFHWEEPIPEDLPHWLTRNRPRRESLRERMRPGFTPSEEPGWDPRKDKQPNGRSKKD